MPGVPVTRMVAVLMLLVPMVVSKGCLDSVLPLLHPLLRIAVIVVTTASNKRVPLSIDNLLKGLLSLVRREA